MQIPLPSRRNLRELQVWEPVHEAGLFQVLPRASGGLDRIFGSLVGLLSASLSVGLTRFCSELM